MRTLLFILGGIALFVIFVFAARTLFRGKSGHMRIACISFLLAWCAVAAYNMWIGVYHAGYSVSEELPIFLVIFGIPAAVAVVAGRRVSRSLRSGA